MHMLLWRRYGDPSDPSDPVGLLASSLLDRFCRGVWKPWDIHPYEYLYQVIVSLHARDTQCLDRSGLYPSGGHILVLLELLSFAYQDSPGWQVSWLHCYEWRQELGSPGVELRSVTPQLSDWNEVFHPSLLDFAFLGSSFYHNANRIPPCSWAHDW